MNSLNVKNCIIICLFLVIGCTENNRNNQLVNVLPNDNLVEEIQNKSLLRSGYEVNILDEIYEKLEESRPDLKSLNDNLKELQKFNENPLNEYGIYADKTSLYFNNADILVNSIQDSILRQQMIDILTTSKSTFSKNHTELERLILDFNSKNTNINDMYLSIKLINTLPLIEQYQKQNVEIHEKNYREIIERQSKLIHNLENSMIKK
jgi:alpha-N-acetylglucosamine transferase